jgi:catechol 2,3-dioxygenase-like lactoylglutathione lyase family enzyme
MVSVKVAEHDVRSLCPCLCDPLAYNLVHSDLRRMGEEPVSQVPEGDAGINQYFKSTGFDETAKSAHTKRFRSQYIDLHDSPFHGPSYTRHGRQQRIFWYRNGFVWRNADLEAGKDDLTGAIKKIKKESSKNGFQGGIMRLHHAALVASSEANADKFYGGILKLTKIKTSSLKSDLAVKIFGVHAECPMILYGNENFAIEVFVTDRVPSQKEPFTHLCLEVEDREEFVTTCQSAGLEIKLIPKGDAQVCFARDFDGNLFEIKPY